MILGGKSLVILAALGFAASAQASCSGSPIDAGHRVQSAIDRIKSHGKREGGTWELSYNNVYIQCTFNNNGVDKEDCAYWWKSVRGDFGGIISDSCSYNNPYRNIVNAGYIAYH
ncbi:hypothetical protein BGZ52_002096 [Haplosporangium bisporale]|nr:hypothetical protein BGZ52_002096 [Haplosporangium bisporale]